ncbi:MAG: tetratricopeptide repeat protein [Promethearchaeota archaeon]|jgi:tetratricopeptide (TPR) repeat protein
MPLLVPKELVQARELTHQAKFNEALEIIEQFEKTESLSSEDKLFALLMKGRIYLSKQHTRKAVQTYDIAYQISQDLELIPESVNALIGKANVVFLGDLDKANSYISEAEEKLNSLAKDSSTQALRINLLLIKSWIMYYKRLYNEAAALAMERLKLIEEEKIGNKFDLPPTYLILGWIYFIQGKRKEALDYAIKNIEINKEISSSDGIAAGHSLSSTIHLFEGNYEEALEHCKQGLSVKGIAGRPKITLLRNSAVIHYYKSEMNKVLEYRQQAVSLAEKLNIRDLLIPNLNDLGFCYRVMGRILLAKETFERVLILSEKGGYFLEMARALMGLIWLYIGENSREDANRYFSRLSKLYDQKKNEVDISNEYLFSKANLMKTSPRMRDHVEAQALFKQLIENPDEENEGGIKTLRRFSKENLVFDMGHLCDLLLEELSIYNNPDILDEIIPLMWKMLEMAKEMRNYHWLAETKLLQAKLALIQTDIEEARKLMVGAQRIAELHGLTLLASKISSEHDKLLTQIDTWDNYKNNNAPMRDRIKLASTEDVLERLQGERAVEPTESVDEQSILLMILAEGGVLVFSYPFSEEWKFDDELFGGFLTAFNSISDEIFSEGLDRVMFGNQTVLMEQVENFSICYLYKGETYIAQQKLKKFVEETQKNTFLWQSLEQHYKTSQVLELTDNPPLESLITEIFVSKN